MRQHAAASVEHKPHITSAIITAAAAAASNDSHQQMPSVLNQSRQATPPSVGKSLQQQVGSQLAAALPGLIYAQLALQPDASLQTADNSSTALPAVVEQQRACELLRSFPLLLRELVQKLGSVQLSREGDSEVNAMEGCMVGAIHARHCLSHRQYCVDS